MFLGRIKMKEDEDRLRSLLTNNFSEHEITIIKRMLNEKEE